MLFAQTIWTLFAVDTAVTKDGVAVVELACQRMQGWQRLERPHRWLIQQPTDGSYEGDKNYRNSDELVEHGAEDPLEVYHDFIQHIDDSYVVAYDLDHQLKQTLQPQWKRLDQEISCTEGFCALQLTRRLLDPLPAANHRLPTLREHYGLPEREASALGELQMLVDLFAEVLKPEAEARGLQNWEDVTAFATTPWYPARIAFGKYKGRLFTEATQDPALHTWLSWLAESSHPRSAAVGQWYLAQLQPSIQRRQAAQTSDIENVTSVAVSLYQDPDLVNLRQQIAQAREQLADLEVAYTEEHKAVEVIRSKLFLRLRPLYEQRDALLLKIEYRQRYLDALLLEGQEAAEAVEQEHAQAQEQNEREYEEAGREASQTRELSDEEHRELKSVYRRLVVMYHPDRFANDAIKHPLYLRLMQAINQARDSSDIDMLRQISQDPNGYLMASGLDTLDLGDDNEISKLRVLYEKLLERIKSRIQALEQLRQSSDYELWKLSRDNPDFLETIASQQSAVIQTEIIALEAEADDIDEEIRLHDKKV